jgi:hypothetical protein
MKVYVIKSVNSDIPLAEIRTDGRSVDFIVDNTEGQLPSKVGNSLEALKKYLKSSSIYLEEPTQPTAHLIRYVLSNGDVAEITTDGKTCLLNGNLLTEQEKYALFDAIKRKEIQVSRKSDDIQPVLPKAQKPLEEIKPKQLHPTIQSQMKEYFEEKRKQLEKSTPDMDHEIEDSVAKMAGDRQEVGFVRDLLYWLKHGGNRE